MAKFYPIQIADIQKETKDCSVVTFDIPNDLKEESEMELTKLTLVE